MSVATKEVNTLSNTPTYIVPAHELVLPRYQPEKAQEIFELMDDNEKEKTNYVMTILHYRCETLRRKSKDPTFIDPTGNLLRDFLPLQNFQCTEKIYQYLGYMGYIVRIMNITISPTEIAPGLNIFW